MVALTATVATCGLFLLGGSAPTGGGTDDLPPDGADATSTIATAPSTPSTTTSTTSTTTIPPTTTTTSTTTTTTTTVVEITTTTLRPTPVPPSVTASSTLVGLGGRVTFDGTCAGGRIPGTIVVWITDERRSTTSIVDTGLTVAPWTYVWTAPTDERDAASFVFRFWCGDPTTIDGEYPADRQVRVDMVASAAPTTIPTSAPTTPPAPSVTPGLPETN